MHKILIIDDTQLLRMTIKQYLEPEGFQIFEAENTYQVTHNSFSSDYGVKDMDLIILDLYLKDEDGMKLLSLLHNKLPEIPVIIISSENKSKTVRKTIMHGARDYILKPFDKTYLIQRINRLLFPSSTDSKKTDDNSRLETDLSLELNRTIRGENNVTLLSFDFTVEDRIISRFKETITSQIRDIDRSYNIEGGQVVLLLPLTDKEGSLVLKNRLDSVFKNETSIEKEIYMAKIFSFPADIDEDIDYNNLYSYKEKMLEMINIKN